MFEYYFQIKKHFFILVFFILSARCAFAQGAKDDSPKQLYSTYSLGAEFVLPIGLFGQIYSSAIGASAQGNFGLTKNVALTLRVGYLSYFLKSTYGGGSEGFVPVLGGAEFNITPAIFGAVQLGLTFSTLSGGGSAFTFSPGIGYNISKKVNTLLKYTGKVKSAIVSNSVGLKVAYTLGR